MNVARILYPVEVLGPGKRIGIWFAGCQHQCEGCSNPELWEMRPEYEIPVDKLTSLLCECFANQQVDGLTLTGGDPLLQCGELESFLAQMRHKTDDILVYTGYTYAELLDMRNPCIEECLANIDVLVDGRYEESLNDGAPLRGSSNQKIIYLRQDLKAMYTAYLAGQRDLVQNFISRDGIISVGIHRPDFLDRIEAGMKQKGLVITDG